MHQSSSSLCDMTKFSPDWQNVQQTVSSIPNCNPGRANVPCTLVAQSHPIGGHVYTQLHLPQNYLTVWETVLIVHKQYKREDEEEGEILLLGSHEAHRCPQGTGTLRKTKIGLVYILSETRDCKSQEGFIKCCKAVFLRCIWSQIDLNGNVKGLEIKRGEKLATMRQQT